MLYENLTTDKNNNHQPRKETSIRIALFTAVAFIIIVLAGIIWYVGTFFRFREFVSHLSDSTHYAYENLSVQATYEGSPLIVKRNNLYDAYTYLTTGGPGSQTKNLPSEEPALVVDYGDGSSISFWGYEGKNIWGQNKQELFIYYKDHDYSYAYSTQSKYLELVYSTLKKLK